MILSVTQGPPTSIYTLDNNAPFAFNITNVPNDTNIFPFYQSPPGLVDGSHSLLITSVGTFFILDAIVYGSDVSNSSATSSTSPTTGATALSFPSSTSKLPVGGIVGAIIAALVLFLVVGLIMFYRPRRVISFFGRKTSDTELEDPSIPEPFLLGSPSETRCDAQQTRESRSLSEDLHEGTISSNFPFGLNVNSEPSHDSVIWGSIPRSVSTASTVVGDRAETSFVGEKDGRVLRNSLPKPVTAASNYHSSVVSAESRITWNTRESAPPPSWTGLSDAPPSYTY